jgi:hypothetical protein
MKKNLPKIIVATILIFSGLTVKAQSSSEKKNIVEERGFNIVIDAKDFTDKFVKLGIQVTGVKAIKLDKNESDLNYVRVIVEQNIKPDINYIENFCVKSNIMYVYINNEKVSSNLYAEKMGKHLESTNGRNKEK